MTNNSRSYSKNIRDLLIYPAVIWTLAYSFMGITNFEFNWNAIYGIPQRIKVVCYVIIIFYAVYNLITVEDNSRRLVFAGLIILGLFTSNIIFLLMVALAERSMKQWLSIGVGTYITMFGITIISASFGIIGMGTHGAWEGNFFGMQTEGQFSFVLLFLLLQIAILRQGKFTYYEYIAIIIIIFFNTYFYNKRNANICMILFVLMLISYDLFCHIRSERGDNKIVFALQKYCFDYSFLWAFGIFTACVFLRDYIRLLQTKFPWLMTLVIRFEDTAEIWRAFPLTLLGNNIRENGSKNATVMVFDPLFSRTLLFDGLIVLVVMMIVSTYFMVKARKMRYEVMYLAFMVMALFSISDPVAWGISMNFLIVLPFTEWDISVSYRLYEKKHDGNV